MKSAPANPSPEKPRALRIIGEVLSQLLNVPILSGALITIIFFKLPTDIPNRVGGFGLALLFISLIPLCSLFFYIPGKVKNWPTIIKRQRIASFVIMIISYPIGFLALRLSNAPLIFEAIAVNYTLITLGLIIFNLILRYKASGHTAGVAGPATAMLFFFGLSAAPLVTLIPLTIFARIAAKGHNFWQLITGSVLSISTTVLVLFLYGFNPLSHLY
ncbi:MAG: hypothetical protein HN922_13295 [Anaerolineae bacterium]|jgi:membrane-associated phospholipid phosphatase|nr:hypothetical protein [Anaerolineae bacterium]MBT7781617.1 hypothetical protein [Anaerolineae bacterium]